MAALEKSVVSEVRMFLTANQNMCMFDVGDARTSKGLTPFVSMPTPKLMEMI